jgi:type 1 glutamine amidotransferase
MSNPTALVVRGGWPGHEPVEQTDALLPYLRSLGLEVVVSDNVASYADAELMARVTLVVQYWTYWTDGNLPELPQASLDGLRAAIAAGTGFAGWHGGIADSFRASVGYLQLTGGQFVDHPGGVIDFEVVVRPEQASNPIVAGIGNFRVTSEQYWVLSDSHNSVLAETTVAPSVDGLWKTPIVSPTVWTRTWGEGRIFVSTIGHSAADLEVPEVRAILERGLRWAAKL